MPRPFGHIPFQTYLTVENAGNEPTPFFVGLKIEGGVYDGRELILAWPDTDELPTKLPNLSGSGGNECNAGSDNKNDSTLEGQRPGLPQDPEDEQDTQEQEPPQEPNDEQDAQELVPSQKPNDEQDAPEPPQEPNDEQKAPKPEPPQKPNDGQDAQGPEPPQNLKEEQDAQEPGLPQIPEEEPKDNPQEQFRNFEDGTDGQTTGKEDSYTQTAIDETFPALIAGVENPESILAVSAETGSPQADRKSALGTEHSLYRFLLPAAAIIAIGLCIVKAAGKDMVGNTFGNISRKMMYAINRLLHLK